MKTNGGVGVLIHDFLTTALVGAEWSASRPGRFIPRNIAPSTLWIGSRVGPRAGLDDVEERKLLTPPGLEPRPLGRPAFSQLLAGINSYNLFCFLGRKVIICKNIRSETFI
jgi:hypothetical protein